MKKILIGGMIACLVAVAAIAGIGIYRHQGEENTVEPEEKRAERQRVDPAEFEAEEICWVDLFSYNEGEEKLEYISLWLYPGEEEVTINGEKFALSEELGNELRELILQYSQVVKEREDEYWPHTSEYPDMLVLFKFDMRGEEKQYKADGALCYPDGWEGFIENLEETIYKYGVRQEPEEPEEKITDKEKEEIKDADPAEFEEDEIIYFNLFSYHENVEEMESITLWLAPGEEEASINNETIKLSEEQGNELRQLILQYSLIVKEQEDEYWPNTSEYPEIFMIFDFVMSGGEKEYKADGALCYPDGWEEFIEDVKEIIL